MTTPDEDRRNASFLRNLNAENRAEIRRLRLLIAASAVMGFSVGLIVAITLYSLHMLP